jgi:hypothetical protein
MLTSTPPTPACPPTLPHLSSQIGKLARCQAVDDLPHILVRVDRRTHGRLIGRTNVNSLRPSVQVHREEATPVPCRRVVSAGAVGPATPPKTLDQRATHQARHAQAAQLLAQLLPTTLDLFAFGCHV